MSMDKYHRKHTRRISHTPSGGGNFGADSPQNKRGHTRPTMGGFGNISSR